MQYYLQMRQCNMERRKFVWNKGLPLLIPAIVGLFAYGTLIHDRADMDLLQDRSSGLSSLYPIRIDLSSSPYPIRVNLSSATHSRIGDAQFRSIFDLGGSSSSADDVAQGAGVEEKTEAPRFSQLEAATAAFTVQGGIAARPALNKRGFINLDFDLGDRMNGADFVNLSKPLFLDNELIGQSVIKIQGDRDVYFRADIVDLLKSHESSASLAGVMEGLGSGSEYISWNRLRDKGVSVKYDPIRDRIILQS